MKDSLEKLIYLLNSNNDKYIKIAIYALRKFFVDKVKNNNLIDEKGNVNLNENNFYLDDFINLKIYDKLFFILHQNKKDYINCYEIFWILLDSSIFPSKIGENPYDYYFNFLSKENIDLYNYYIIDKQTPKEIILLLIKFISNLCLFNEKIRLLLLKKNFISNSFSKIKNLNENINYDVFSEFYHLFSIITKNYNNFDLNSSKIFFHIFSSPLNIINDEEIEIYCLYGLEKLSKIKDEDIIKLFTESNNIINNYKTFLESPLKEESIIYFLKILSNLLLNTNSINIKNFIQKISILNIYLFLINPSIINLFNEKENIKSEIIIGLGNLCLIDLNYIINIINNDNIYNFLLNILNESNFTNKIYVLKTLYNIFKTENIQYSQDKIFFLLKKLSIMMKIEKNKNLIKEIIDLNFILISILINNNESNIEGISLILNNLGYEDIIQRKEIYESLNEEQYNILNSLIGIN